MQRAMPNDRLAIKEMFVVSLQTTNYCLFYTSAIEEVSNVNVLLHLIYFCGCCFSYLFRTFTPRVVAAFFTTTAVGFGSIAGTAQL